MRDCSSFKKVLERFLVSIGLVVFAFSACKNSANIKDFVEREVARDAKNDDVKFSESAVASDGKVYVPSQKDITGEIKVTNEMGLELKAELVFQNPADKKYFEGVPKLQGNITDKATFSFKFKKDADGNKTSRGVSVPLSLKLIKKHNNTEFANKPIVLRCNTQPNGVRADYANDEFTIILPNDELNQDIEKLNCEIGISDKSGNELGRKSVNITDVKSKSSSIKINVGDVFGNDKKSGFRFIKLIYIDSVGLSNTFEVSKSEAINKGWEHNYPVTPPTTPNKFKVTFGVDGGNGTIEARVNGNVITSQAEVDENAVVEFTATPDSDYEVEKWEGANADNSDNTKASVTVTSDVNVKIKFKEKNVYTIDSKKYSKKGDAWKELKETVKAIKQGESATIKIKGDIQATYNDKTIEIFNKNIVFEGDGSSSSSIDGGGYKRIFDISASDNVTFRNLALKNGKGDRERDGGGAIYCADSKLTFDNVVIKDCKSEKKGGGVYAKAGNTSGTKLVFNNTTIQDCSSEEDGGGVYFMNSDFTATDTKIIGNSAAKEGGGIYANEGGKLTLNSCEIVRNNCSAGAGASVKCRLFVNGSTTFVGSGDIDTSNDLLLKTTGGGIPVTIEVDKNGLTANKVAKITLDDYKKDSMIVKYDSKFSDGSKEVERFKIVDNKYKLEANSFDLALLLKEQ